MIEHYCDEHKLTKFECLECLMTDNPWRYPSKGELPEKDDERYQVTWRTGDVGESFGMQIIRLPKEYRAWRTLAPAPKLEE